MKRSLHTYLVLLRGINVGGRNVVKMADLRTKLSKLGYTDVRTYIQSGNIAFEAAQSKAQIKKAVGYLFETSYTFVPEMVVLTGAELHRIVGACPYIEEAAEEPKSVHVVFCDCPPPKAALKLLDEVRAPQDAWSCTKAALYLRIPKGFARSRLADRAQRSLGVTTTARNWRSVLALQKLAQG